MKLRNVLENIIIVAIMLVIAHTLVAEIAVYKHWSIKARNIIIYTGLGFDLLFTVEFLVRSISSRMGKKFFRYLFYERGWVDFLSSVPLLLFDSGPSVYLLLFGTGLEPGLDMGTLGVVKIVKAIRITRILRLIRIIKIFGKIHNTSSRMAQHHTATITTTAVFTVIITVFSYTFFENGLYREDLKRRQAYYTGIVTQLIHSQKERAKPANRIMQHIFNGDRAVLAIRYNNRPVIENVSGEELAARYQLSADYEQLDGDYSLVTLGNYVLYLSKVDINRRIALDHIKSFMIIIMLVMAFMFIYTRHFAQYISDIVHILNKGFRKKNYNLQVKIKGPFKDEEIYRLARYYNESFLPAKFRQISSSPVQEHIELDDLADFGKDT